MDKKFREIIQIIVISVFFCTICYLYMHRIDAIFNDLTYSNLKYFIPYIFLHSIVILNLYIKFKNKQIINLLAFFKSSILYYFLISLFIYLLIMVTAYFGFIDHVLFYIAYIIMMKYIYNLRNISTVLFVGVILYIFSLPLAFDIEGIPIYDLLLVVMCTFIFPLFAEIGERKRKLIN